MIRWVIQNNLGSENEINDLIKSCKKSGAEVQEVVVIPFSEDLPSITIDDKINIYYGATTFMYNVFKSMDKPLGLFFDDESFSMENFNKHWKDFMLNSEGNITSFKEFINEKYEDDKSFFIRPDADDKSFAGIVMSFGDIKNFIENAVKFDNVILTENTKILVNTPYNIEKEWRNYIVDGKVVTSSLYRKNFKLFKDGIDIPESMIKFVEDRCKEYTPHAIFAMDIALCNGEYFIIECGCMNSVGLYHCDKDKLINAINDFV